MPANHRPFTIRALFCLAGLIGLTASPGVADDPPNILVVILDDLGIEHVESYDIGDEGEYAPLNNFQDRLTDNVENWKQINHAISNPYCSPTRSTILTGLYGKDTGTGWLIAYGDDHILDTTDSHLLPKELQGLGYETGAFGKWHLGVEEDGDDYAPIEAGFDYYEGFLLRYNGYQSDPYLDFQWTTVDGTNDALTERVCREQTTPPDCDVVSQTAYLTKYTIQAAIDWIHGATEPWFAYVALPAPHAPWSCPPEDAYIGDEYGGCDADPNDTLEQYRGMLMVADEQIDRLLDDSYLDLTSDTYAFVLSDNGSPDDEDLALSPFDNINRVKCSVFQGGVRVPFFVGGPTVVDGEVGVTLPINVSDTYMTILELAGATSHPRSNAWEQAQAQSFLGDYLQSSAPQSRVRDCVYTEVFEPNGLPLANLNVFNRAIMGITATGGAGNLYKWIEQVGGAQIGLFHLTSDAEGTNLCGTLGCSSGTTKQIISELKQCRDQFNEECTLADLGEACDYNSDCCPGLVCDENNECSGAL